MRFQHHIRHLVGALGLLVATLAAPRLLAADKIAGVSVVSPPRPVDAAWLTPVQQLNAGWVAVMPYAFGRLGSSELHYDIPRQWWGERFEGIRVLVRQAHARGLKVMLKPMVWVHGAWSGTLGMDSEEQWREWEANYRRYILGINEIAVQEQVEILCVGTELKTAVAERQGFFLDLIDRVRQTYKGQVTYAANWDDYLVAGLWEKTDYIGIDAYFPLSPDTLPSVKALKAAWLKHIRAIGLLYNRYRKPVLFTEFGYRSLDICCWRQWEREHLGNDMAVNLQAQVNAYEAFFQSFWDRPWFAGVFLWQWYTDHGGAGGAADSDFTPQNKPSEQAIRKWYGGLGQG